MEDLPVGLRERLDGDGGGSAGQTFAQILKRPEVTVEEVAPLLLEWFVGAGLGVWRWLWRAVVPRTMPTLAR